LIHRNVKRIFYFFGLKAVFTEKKSFSFYVKGKSGKASRKNLTFPGYFRHDISA
jgi:hypothetical protein